MLPWKYACLLSRYLATVAEYLLIPRTLPSNGFTCHNIKWLQTISIEFQEFFKTVPLNKSDQLVSSEK
jgi:hypothetical protein